MFRDSGAPLSAGPGCTGQPDGAVACAGEQVTVELADGNDRIQSTRVLTTVRGGDGDDVLAGGATLEGGAGNDTLNGSVNSDRLLGGSGRDLLSAVRAATCSSTTAGWRPTRSTAVQAATSWPSANETNPCAPISERARRTAGSEAEGNTVANIERVSGGRGPDELLGDPAAAPSGEVTLIGGDGDDQLVIRGAGTKVLGGPGGDTITGGPGIDSIDSGLGSDVVRGEGGDDLLDGGDAPDDLDGGDGRDIILGGDSADRVLGGQGNDRVAGGGGRDVMRGDAGNDFLNGGGGNDQLFGGAGRDRLLGDTGADLLNGRADADRLEGGPHGDRILGLGGGDRIIGGSGADRVSGGAGTDVVSVADRSRDRVELRARLGPGHGRPARPADGVRARAAAVSYPLVAGKFGLTVGSQ